MEKQCKKCLKTRPIDDFYKHSMMADGHLSKCKECTRADVNENREANAEYYKNYDRNRYDESGRRGPVKHPNHNEHNRAWFARNKEKKRANVILKRAVESGALVRPSMCSKCGERGKIEGHHADYSKPLEVEWLCTGCHGETWKKERKGLQAKKRGGYKGSMLPTRAVLP